ncbi:MAG TPA: CRTAC1 family protein [Planctomycetota bacterium]|jgi:hypothetical protein|nr:CRTAC1 family protein [Planctomycetota bacterium]
MRSGVGALLAIALALVVVFRSPQERPKAETPTPAPAPAPPADDDGPPGPTDPPPFAGEKFTWMKEALPGWRHDSGASAEYRVPEITCGGVVLLDADGDGDVDVFLANGGIWTDLHPGAKYPGHALFLNDGNFKFHDVARAAGVFGEDGAYCLGAAAADYDGDGDQDLYVTAFAGNYLYRNDGVKDGIPRFTECAAAAGVRGTGKWSSSAAFVDGDRDGLLDLYVCNYLEFNFEANRRLRCGGAITGVVDYCAPVPFAGAQDFYFRNEGGGKFKECALAVGLGETTPLSDNGKSLGVVASDVDDDGDPDLYVANDECANTLFLNDGHGRFHDVALVAGCALNENGQTQAGMGVDAGDFDGDGDFDLWVTNLDVETNALYVNDGKGSFSDEVRASGLGPADKGSVGFGTDFLDWDDDGDLDVVIANGHVLIHVHKTRGTLFYKQLNQLFENDGKGKFRLLPPQEAGAFFMVRNAARGMASGDLDGDGDLDLVFVRRDDTPVVLRNNHVERHVEQLTPQQIAAHGGRSDSIVLRLRGKDSNRDAIGARVRVTVGGKTLVEEARAGNSYGSRNDLALHFGTGGATTVDAIEVRWPDGATTKHGPVETGFAFTLGADGTTEKGKVLAPKK